MDYAAYRAKPRRERLRIFNSVTPEEKAQLVQTQIREWLEAHQHGLLPQQIAILLELIEFVNPELYQSSRVGLAAFEARVERTATLLGVDQMAQALTDEGRDCPDFRVSPVELSSIPNSPHLRIELGITSAFGDPLTVRVRVLGNDLLADRAVLLKSDPARKRPPNPATARVTSLLPIAGPDFVTIVIEADTPGSRLWPVLRIEDAAAGDVILVSPAGRKRPTCE